MAPSLISYRTRYRPTRRLTRGNVPAAEVLAAVDGPRPRPGVVASSPYRGLAAFEEQDAAFFFGRETAATAVLDRMSRLLAGTGLLVVSGASGAGKSSLLRAGALPRIRKDGLAAAPGAASWPRVVFTPTRTPLDELALRVAPLATGEGDGTMRAWNPATDRPVGAPLPTGDGVAPVPAGSGCLPWR